MPGKRQPRGNRKSIADIMAGFTPDPNRRKPSNTLARRKAQGAIDSQLERYLANPTLKTAYQTVTEITDEPKARKQEPEPAPSPAMEPQAASVELTEKEKKAIERRARMAALEAKMSGKG